MKRVLVTGASGCLGRHALPALAARGWEVHGTARRPPVGLTHVTWHPADLMDGAAIDRLVATVEPTHLLHLAWYIAPGRWAAAPENIDWVESSLRLLRAFRRAGGVRVVTAGSCLEYDWQYGYCSEDLTPCRPHTVYGASKHALQMLTTAMAGTGAFSSAWGRVFFVFGPGEHPDRLVPAVVRALQAGQPARTSHGDQIRDYLYAADAADALVSLLESAHSGPLNIASGVPIALKEIVGRLGTLMGRPDLIRLGAIPPAATDVPLVVANTTRLRDVLGWKPRVALDDGLRATISSWSAETQEATHSS